MKTLISSLCLAYITLAILGCGKDNNTNTNPQMSASDQNALEGMHSAYNEACVFNDSLLWCADSSQHCTDSMRFHYDFFYHHNDSLFDHHHMNYSHSNAHDDHDKHGTHHGGMMDHHDTDDGHHQDDHDLMDSVHGIHHLYHP